MLRELMDTAGLHVTEVAELLGISRNCVHTWLREGVKPRQRWSREATDRLTQRIQKAVAGGVLPLKEVRRGERLGMLKRILL